MICTTKNETLTNQTNPITMTPAQQMAAAGNGLVPVGTSGGQSVAIPAPGAPGSAGQPLSSSVQPVGAVAAPISYDPVIMNSQCQNDYAEFNYTSTGAKSFVVFSALLAGPGDYVNFDQPSNAFDTATVSDDFGIACAKTQGFNDFIKTSPVMVAQVQVQSNVLANVTAQPRLGYFTPNSDLIKTKMLVGLCDACLNNNNSGTYTRIFSCPITLGKNIYFAYPIPAGTDEVPSTLMLRFILGGIDSQVSATPLIVS
jgi:hypothetical protein